MIFNFPIYLRVILKVVTANKKIPLSTCFTTVLKLICC